MQKESGPGDNSWSYRKLLVEPAHKPGSKDTRYKWGLFDQDNELIAGGLLYRSMLGALTGIARVFLDSPEQFIYNIKTGEKTLAFIDNPKSALETLRRYLHDNDPN